MQNGVQPAGKELQREQAAMKKAPENQELTATYASIQSRRLGDTGFDDSGDAKAETALDGELYARLYALDPQLAHLMDLWPLLTIQDRQALVERADQLASIDCTVNE